jgi:choice-of-anchor B domain-containing protein
MRTFFTAAMLVAAPFAFAQLNMSVVGNLSYQALHGSDISDVWGYVDQTGIEYALIGVNGGGVSVVSLADPTDPQEVFWFPGANTIWRDLKVWNDHVYVTNEGGGGLAIIDLSPLPFSTDLTAQNWAGGGWTSAHNLYIDENGIAYISGANRGNGGVIFLDLNGDPFEPVEVGEFDTWYSHDCMTRGDTMYAAHINAGWFSIVDVSDKQNPQLLGTRTTGNNFTHNCWVSDDGNYLFTTDEVTGGWLGSYDISDPTDIQELQLFRSAPGSNTIPHNTHFINEYVVTSYYRLGTTIHDVSRPWNVVEVANYDHCPLQGSGFNGGWGTYPWLPSGLIISSDIEGGLFVLDAEYIRACWLEGTIRNAQTSVPVANATLQIVGIVTADVTGFDGAYATGHHTGGTYEVFVSAPGYESATVTGVVLENGVVTFLDIDLVPLVSFTIQGIVVDAVTGEPIEGALISKQSPIYGYEVLSGADGTFQVANMFADNYEVVAGRWGWRTVCLPPQSFDASSGMLTIELEPGYYDDFVFDFGWTVESTASVGFWERGAPVGTTFQGNWSNPNSDVEGDCGDQAYVTGNGGGSAGADDVDDGNTVLTSPVFDATTLWDPLVKYYRWFFNAGGAGTPNDRMTIFLSDGSNTVPVENITTSASAWVPSQFRIHDHMVPTETMQLIVFITDDDPGHLVEGGFDVFEVVEGGQVGVEETLVGQPFRLWPNPGDGRFQVQLAHGGDAILELFDALGRSVGAPHRVMQGFGSFEADLPSGTYLVRVTTPDGARAVQRLVVDR